MSIGDMGEQLQHIVEEYDTGLTIENDCQGEYRHIDRMLGSGQKDIHFTAVDATALEKMAYDMKVRGIRLGRSIEQAGGFILLAQDGVNDYLQPKLQRATELVTETGSAALALTEGSANPSFQALAESALAANQQAEDAQEHPPAILNALSVIDAESMDLGRRYERVMNMIGLLLTETNAIVVANQRIAEATTVTQQIVKTAADSNVSLQKHTSTARNRAKQAAKEL